MAYPNKISEIRLLPALRAEESIIYQLAEIGLRLHKLGRLEIYRQIIAARDDLLVSLDAEESAPGKDSAIVQGVYVSPEQAA